MMRYNFRPNLTDHSQIMILVRPFFTTSEGDYDYVFKMLSPYKYAKFQESDRRIFLNFTRGYSRDTLEWGRVQLHRRPLGFIGVARLSSDPVQQSKDYEKIEQRFGNLTNQYENFLYDSRCIIIGPADSNIVITHKNMYFLPELLEDTPADFVAFISEFISSIFLVLESKRIDKTCESIDRMVLPTAPHEHELTVTDSDTRNLKRKCTGRNEKILGDLCILSGLYNQAWTHYNLSLDCLRGLNDLLWTACAIEGVCAAWILNSLSKGEIEEPNCVLLLVQDASINANVRIEERHQEKATPFHQTLDEVIAKYSECLSCLKRYSIIQNASGPVELEAHFKFIRILLAPKRKLEIAQIIQSLLGLKLNFNDNEKIEFTKMISSIYDQIDLKRKAAFFRRRTAIYYMNNSQMKLSLSKAMGLLHQILSAYKLSLNPEDLQSCVYGWSSLQIRVLLEMLQISRSLENKVECVRLVCFILEIYSSQLSSKEYEELVNMMEEFSDDSSDNNECSFNTKVDGTNVCLIKPLPIIRDFRPKKLAYHLRPIKSQLNEQKGPFIFSSLMSKSQVKEDIIWVCGDVSEVTMVVDNPLPAEIKVTNMTLITEGINFEAHPATLALPAKSGSFPFMLLGTPSQPGNLVIKGYKVEFLGISNTVYLERPLNVEVTPHLPVLKLSSTLPQAYSASALDPTDKHYQTLFTQANLYRGHSCTGKVSLENTGLVSVTRLDIKLEKLRAKCVIFNEELVQSQLPLLPHNTLYIDIVVMPGPSWKLFNDQEKIEATLSITYSCENGESDGFIREISMVTYIKVMASLELSNYNIQEIERHASCCLICFDALNMTSIPMNITCEVDIDWDDVGVDDVCHFIQKKQLIELSSKKTTRCEVHFPRLALPLEENKKQTLENMYRSFLMESMTFSWRLSGTSYSGVTYLQNIPVTCKITNMLKPKHTHNKVQVNNEVVKDKDYVKVETCTMIELRVSLTNTREQQLDNLVLYINVYQQNVHRGEMMVDAFLPSGTLTKGLKKLSPSETYDHNCGLFFLHDGEFSVDVSCYIEQKLGLHFLKDHSDIEENFIKSPSPKSPNSGNKKFNVGEKTNLWTQIFTINVGSH